MHSRRAVLAGAAALVVAGPPARADNPFVDGAAAFIKDLADRAIAVLNNRSMPAGDRVAAFRALFLEGFDVPSIAQFVMGRAWTRATEEQRRTYLKLFEEVTLLTWALRFNEYGGETLKLNKARAEGRVAFVESQVIRPGRDPVRVEWRIERPAGAYKILDIGVEGTSMAIAQRADYSAVLQQGNGRIDALIAALAAKRDQLNEKARQLARN